MTSRKILRARKSEMNTRKGSHRKRLPERPIFELTLLERRVLLSAITNYNYSFETGTSTTGWSVPIEVDTSNAITGWGSTDYLKGPATLTLNSLPAHTGAVVSFDIYALDEWDGNNSPSAFTLKANGATVVSTNFANTWATGTVTNNDPNPPTTEIDSTCYTQSYPAANGDATLAPQSGAVAVGDMDSDGELLTDYSCTSCDCGGGCCGCGCCGGGGTVTWTVTPIYGGNISDAVYQFTVPIDDSSSTLALDFGGSFPVGAAMGIDNVNVTLAQPEIAGINSDGNGVDLFSGTISNSVDGPSLDDIDMDMGSTISADGGDIADILFTGLGGSSSLGNGDANLAAAGDNGSGTASGNVSELLQSGDNTIALSDSGSLSWFDSVGGTWTERYGGSDKLAYDSTNSQFILTDSSGNQSTFYDFTGGVLAGKIKSVSDAGGNVTNYSYNGSGQPTLIVNSATSGTVTTKEALAYSYLASPDPNAGKVGSITWQTKTYDTSLGQSDSSVSYSIVKETDYTYYNTGDSGGSLGDLEMAQTKDPSGNVIDTQFNRYYISGDSDTHGYVGAPKYEFGTSAYARLVESLTGGATPATATDAQVAPYADHYYQYNSNHQVTGDVVGGAGGNSSGGQGTDSLSYTDSGNATGYNYWNRKTTETLPDGTTQYHYFNAYGEELLSVTEDTSGNLWGTFTEYDDEGRVILSANPSAVNIPSLSTIEQYPDLLNESGGNYEYLNDSTGLITTTSYYSGTSTATSTTAGSAAGYESATYIQDGETGTPVEQESWQYYAFSAGNTTTYPVATDTTYGNTNGTDTRTTRYSYTLYSGTVQPKLETVTLPTISTGQNGPNTTDAQSTFYDTYGRPIWTKDADGHVNYTAYDMATGATTQTITDVTYSSLTSDQKSSFDLTGWTDPTGGLNLVTNYEVDNQGRTIKEVSPHGNVTYTVYDDANHETRVYSGWQSTTGTASAAASTTTLICSSLIGANGAYIGQTLLITGGTDSGQSTVITGYDASTHTLTFSPAFTSATSTSSTFVMAGATGPIEVSREYDASADSGDFSYDETLTTSAAASIDSTGAPTGQETISSSNITSLSRQFMNAAGQVAWSDVYFNLSGITYSQAVGADGDGNPADLGTEGTNYYRTTTSYDSAGRADRVVSATGTITRTVYDALGRTVSEWEGTCDTPASGTWTPTNNGGSSNMIEIVDNQYDGGGVGDSNLTQVTQHPANSQPDRVTQYLYDWRGRQVVEKDGVQSSESDGTHRPITYTVYDNLGEVTESDRYDGDGVTLSSLGSTAGVPNAPSSSLLRAKTVTSYDAWNRLVQVKQGASVVESRSYYADLHMASSSDNCAGVTTESYYSSDWQVLEDDTNASSGMNRMQYVWGQGYMDQLVARDDNSTSGSLGATSSGYGRRIFAVQDVNHDVTALVDNSASVLHRFTYNPYGNSNTNSYGWLYQFQGGRVDTVSGLYNFRNRDYNPGFGVWVEQDPSGYRGTMDLYGFDNGSPSTLNDPFGLDPDDTAMVPASTYVNLSNLIDFKWLNAPIVLNDGTRAVGRTQIESIDWAGDLNTDFEGIMPIKRSADTPAVHFRPDYVRLVMMVNMEMVRPNVPVGGEHGWPADKSKGWEYVLLHETMHVGQAVSGANRALNKIQIHQFSPTTKQNKWQAQVFWINEIKGIFKDLKAAIQASIYDRNDFYDSVNDAWANHDSGVSGVLDPSLLGWFPYLNETMTTTGQSAGVPLD